jgi:hypothetical protein
MGRIDQERGNFAFARGELFARTPPCRGGPLLDI